MSAAKPNAPLDLRTMALAQAAAKRQRLLRRALDTRRPTPNPPPLDAPVATAPNRRSGWFNGVRWRRPKLVIHPVTLGILSGVAGVIALAVIIPHIGASVTKTPSLGVPAGVTANLKSAPATLSKAPATAIAAKPVDRLQIPSLGINAPVTSVGLIKGALDTPKTLWQVGHYTGSSSVGSLGTAIMVGHSGAPGQIGVFEHLSKLAVGATITYRYVDGRAFTYRVLTSAAYPENQATASLLFHDTANPTLNLISCYGTWNAATQDYNQRWIVTAQLVTD